MKIIALAIDCLREIYAKKVIIGIIIIEVVALTIAGFALFSEGIQQGYHEALTPPAVTDSAGATPRARADDGSNDTSLLGSDTPLPSDSASRDTQNMERGGRSKVLLDSAGDGKRVGQRLLENEVIGQMSAFAVPTTGAAIFFGIFILAGIIPSLMEKGTIDLLLSKPISRTTILFGRALGGFTAIAVNLFFFLLAAYILYGLASGVWIFQFVTYGFAIPMFALLVLYAGILFLNVTTEGFVLPMILAYLNLTVVGITLFSREELLFTMIESPVIRTLIDGIYYALPQTADMINIVPSAIFTGSIDNGAPFLQGVIFSIVMYSLSAWKFARKDF